MFAHDQYSFATTFYIFLSPLVPVISITKRAQALLDNCSFVCNSFILLNWNAELMVNDCVFHSYNHGNVLSYYWKK